MAASSAGESAWMMAASARCAAAARACANVVLPAGPRYTHNRVCARGASPDWPAYFGQSAHSRSGCLSRPARSPASGPQPVK